MRTKVNGVIQTTPTGYAHFRNVQTANTAAGTFTSGAWRTRSLNTTVLNTISGCSLASNEVTLPAGTYDVEWCGTAHQVAMHLTRLYNVTAAATSLLGMTERHANGTPVCTAAGGGGRIVLAVPTALRIEHYCQTTKATDGLGIPANLDSQSEIYVDFRIWKVA